MLGRKISVQQPDAGKSIFEYDLSGKIVSSQNAVLNANGEQVNYRYYYDQLTSVTYPGHAVTFEYGAPGAADYAAGRLIKQTDRTGTQVFKYTPVGNVKENTRIVVAPQNVPKMFKTSFVYDALGRINKITYPDTEEVLYNYNMAGLLENILSKLPGDPKPRPIAYSMTYDNRDQMTSYLAGNGTKTQYQYDPWGRTKELALLNNTGVNIRKNMYSFDGNGNVTNINGVTPMTGNYPSAYIAVAAQKNFSYDPFGRLESVQILAKGNQNTKYYTLNMKYNGVGNMDVKDFGLKTYLNNGGCQYPVNEGDIGSYVYKNPNHPNAVSSIIYDKFKDFASPLDCGSPTADPRTEGQEDFSYDLNGNLIAIHEAYSHGNNFGQYRNLFWDEQNRLKAVVTQRQNLNYYVYDAGGERILKNDAVSKKLYVNGNNPDETTQMGAFIYYPSGYLVLSEKTMSKHYYMGSQRIATRVSQVPSHRFKINLSGAYDDLANALSEEITGIITQAGLPPEVWIPNEDSQGTFTPPVSASNDPNVCSYIVEQQMMIFEQDHNTECFKKLKEAYGDALANGNVCGMWSDFLRDECMSNYTPPEIVESEMYWIHPDHLGGASILVNSGGKVTNWYEYMPYGEMLMELSNQDYNNPYKYNGKEFDAATGYYYYGARYYDPKRSFWISVDPLAEITQSPYTYVWNDPVNFADPSGMMGERVGGDPDPIVERKIEGVTLKGKRPNWWRRNFGRPIENFFKGSSRNATAGSVPTFSQAPEVHTVGDLSTFGQKVQAYRDYEPDPTDLGGKIIKPIMNGGLDAINYLRNVNPFADKRDYNGLAPRMTKWDGNTMGSEQGQNSSINGIMFMSSFTSLGMTAKGSGLTKVGHWCPKSSYDIMVKTGYTVPEQGGMTFFSTSGPDSWAAAPKKWVYSEMFIESKSLIDGGQPDWLKVVHPESALHGQSQIRTVLKQGGQLNPPIKNLTPILKTK